MAYPGQFVRLAIIGTLYGEEWNTTLAIVPSALGELGMPAVDAATLAGVASDVAAWWPTVGTNGAHINNNVRLTRIKLNRLGTNGRYVDAVAQEHVYPSYISGGAPASPLPAPQLTTVVSLRTAIERGRGSKGRMYLPPTASINTLSTDGRMSTTGALQAANGAKALFVLLNTRYTLVGRVGVASNAGTGRFEHVTRVAAGRVIDTMRSRRSTLLEDYQEVPI
jgi:hypothetical protein